jgi:hypothetical protein
MKNKITEIKNRTIHIEDCLTELKKVIDELEEAEIANAINTSKEVSVNETFRADGTANEMDDVCEDVESRNYIPALCWAGLIVVLVLTIFVSVGQ